ncbi:MAG: DNA photolyase [Desulfobacterales bacterium]|nr:DNA photolyase [Desulfobacterales bacterium]
MKRSAQFASVSTLYPLLTRPDRLFLDRISQEYCFTFQELKLLAEAARDLEMWEETPLEDLWEALKKDIPDKMDGSQQKKKIIQGLRAVMHRLRSGLSDYSEISEKPNRSRSFPMIIRDEEFRKPFGECPAFSYETLCCKLKTIDAVENCAFHCNYCAVQTFYGERITVNRALRENLKHLKINPDAFYHFGTGQSSDSLALGNASGILDDLCEFAGRHPNVMLELKTKSKNISYFLNRPIPRNIVCSWSLNTKAVICHEEYGTASLSERLEAAKQLTGRGVKVAFHFHPLIAYKNCVQEYRDVAGKILSLFNRNEVAFISFGALKFSKSVIQHIRKTGGSTKILQMEMEKDSGGKLTYPFARRHRLFESLYQAFASWHSSVFIYLCMEDAPMWDRVFGWHYENNDDFEAGFKKILCR